MVRSDPTDALGLGDTIQAPLEGHSPGGGGPYSPGEAYTHARTDRVLFLQLLIVQRIRF